MYERAQSYRECGAGITLDVNGMKALRAVDQGLFERFQNAVVTDVSGMQNFDQHGAKSTLKLSCGTAALGFKWRSHLILDV